MTSGTRRSLNSDFTSAPEISCGISRLSCSDFTKRSDAAICGVSNCERPLASNSWPPKPKRIAAW